MKRNHPKQITKHHIIPRSRLSGKKVMGVCKVPRLQHELYHHLFGNMKPDEILDFLNITFWNNQYQITISGSP
jgi:hypothetical protein